VNKPPKQQPRRRPAKKKALAPAAPRPLTERQERFVLEYAIDGNGTRAAKRAGYSPAAATAEASRLLTFANVAEAIERARQERRERLTLTADRITEEIAKIATASIDDYLHVQADGTFWIDLSRADRDQLAALQSAETDTHVDEEGHTSTKVKIRLVDKKGALELAARRLGLLTDNVNNTIETLDADAIFRELDELRREQQEMGSAPPGAAEPGAGTAPGTASPSPAPAPRQPVPRRGRAAP
jgi:phage terminase small subunit